MAKMLASGVGTVAGPEDDRGSVREAVSPSTDAGQALIVAALGLAVLYVTIARSSNGVGAKVGRIAEFVAVVAAATWVANYAARMYAARNPDGPLAAGIRFDA